MRYDFLKFWEKTAGWAILRIRRLLVLTMLTMSDGLFAACHSLGVGCIVYSSVRSRAILRHQQVLVVAIH